MKYQLYRSHIGKDVWLLQEFLQKQNIELRYGTDGVFGMATEDALTSYQSENGLEPDGVFSERTIDYALGDGFPIDPRFIVSNSNSGYKFPERPNTFSSPSSEKMDEMFGTFDFEKDENDPRKENIIIDSAWIDKNLELTKIPQLVNSLIPTSQGLIMHKSGRIRCHRLAVDKFKALFQAWEELDLTKRIIVYSGVFNSRMKRGRGGSVSRKDLSNHSWGTAIDINIFTNGLGTTPPVIGERGCLRELAEVAIELGFYWGGHYKSRPDGMHFELAEI